jgi:DNA-directed RNA polymerase specialized sigma24 family protein
VPDASLVARIATKRDRQALDLLYRRHGGALYDLALGIIPDPVEARRTVAWVFRQAWRTPSIFDSALVPVSAWLVELTRTDAGARAHNHRSNGNGRRRQADTSRDDVTQKRRGQP